MGLVKGFSKFFAKGNTTSQLLQKLANCVEYTRMRGPNRPTEDQAQAILEVIGERARGGDISTLACIAALPVASLHDQVAADCLQLWDELAPPAGLPSLPEYIQTLLESASRPLTKEDANALRRYLRETR